MTIRDKKLLAPCPTIGLAKLVYTTFAKQAVFYEQQQEWSEAQRMWNMASVQAREIANCEWARSRAEYCQRRLDVGC